MRNRSRRGSPLAMLALVLAVWVGGRAMVWENPFGSTAFELPDASVLFAQDAQDRSDAPNLARATDKGRSAEISLAGLAWDGAPNGDAVLRRGSGAAGTDRSTGVTPEVQYAHHMLWLRALGSKLPPSAQGSDAPFAIQEPQRLAGVTPLSPPFEEQQAPDRWSLDVWAFWREGSNASAVSQGRVPIYGASQTGANLQYRLAPSSPHDPRLFARAYRALVSNGETEVAAGASARPIAAMPIRVSAELRVTDTRFGTDLRPAITALTELPPQRLPGGFRLEAYGGAGYVAGNGATPFADGQAAVSREIASFNGPSDNRARLSVGAGAWGGAQRDASRIDVGPTVRLDVTLGNVPARVSVDWRERVGGDASPGSGVAATLSTRF